MEKKENEKGKVENLKWKEEKLQNEERACFFFFFFQLSSKPLKYFFGVPKLEFSTGKKHFTPGKESEKMTLRL